MAPKLETEMVVRTKEKVCYRCGKAGHQPSSCRFRAVKCYKCGKFGHISSVCRSSTFQSRGNARQQAATLVQVQEEQSEREEEELGLFSVNAVEVRSPPIEISVNINGKRVKMIVDTGASVSLISEEVYRSLKQVELQDAEITLTTYTTEPIELLGKAIVKVRYEDQEERSLVVYVPKR